ncbi:MAG TPA: hypothetical protein VL426_05205 [Candidatus Binatia bacterium]|jgi:hypothetical protein|nr:hypothetical protein [Candidatus Binatia bacterium]
MHAPAAWIERHERLLLRCLGAAVFVSLVFFLFAGPIAGVGDPHYLWLADAFLHGRADLPAGFVAAVGRMDTVLVGGRYYWPLGPLPAVLFAPAVAAVGPDMMIESYAHALLALAAFACAYALARRKGFAATDAAWLSAAFGLGSVLVGVVFMNGPWYFESLLSCVLLAAALVEREGKDRPAIVGGLVGLAAATRLPSLLAGGFFFLRELGAARPRREKALRLAVMAAPVLLVLIGLGAYDAARFGDPFRTGQRDHYLLPPAAAVRDAGVFAAANVPRNFFTYFLRLPAVEGGLPVADPTGMSAILLSPVFLWLAAARRKDGDVRAAACCALLLLALLLSYFTDGSRQFGARYLADALPLAYLVLLGVFRERGLGASAKTVIAASAAANLAMFWLFALRHVYAPG